MCEGIKSRESSNTNRRMAAQEYLKEAEKYTSLLRKLKGDGKIRDIKERKNKVLEDERKEEKSVEIDEVGEPR